MQAAQTRQEVPASQPEPAADNGTGQNNTEMAQNVPEKAPIVPEKKYRATFWLKGTPDEIKAPKQWAVQLLFTQVMPTAIRKFLGFILPQHRTLTFC